MIKKWLSFMILIKYVISMKYRDAQLMIKSMIVLHLKSKCYTPGKYSHLRTVTSMENMVLI